MAINIDSKELVTSYLNRQSNENVSITRSSVGTSAPGGFSRALMGAQLQGRVGVSTPLRSDTPMAVVRSGDTMTGIVKNFLNAQGVTASENDASRLVQDLARANGINNANRIFPGQYLQLGPLQQFAQASREQRVPDGSLAQVSTPTVPGASEATSQAIANATVPPTQLFLKHRADAQANPVLARTLDRAVSKGFIPASERQAVEDKILQMSRDYKFAPDDFARVTLMESDGMNPKASNNRCHGIIQFCDGPDRGAASVGYATNPKAILQQSVLQQLDMVAKYFDDTGLKNFGPAGLDDLYLTVLTPAARQETRRDVGLNIAGAQAPHLYANRDTRTTITRTSLLQGLHQNAAERLGMDARGAARNMTQGGGQAVANPSGTRMQPVRVSAYWTPTSDSR